MKLSITATLTEEEVIILAKQKWWNETIIDSNFDENQNIVHTEKLNPLTASEFIVNVYQSMIVQDATKVFTEYRTQELKQQIAQTENIVTEQVTQAITSSIGNV